MDALPEWDSVLAGQRGRYRSLSLSGCNAEHTMAGLGDRFENRHLWRISLPVLMSRPHPAIISLPDHPRAERFLARELRKEMRATIREAACDLVLFDFAGDYLIEFLRFEDCVVPDIRNSVFESDWAGIDFSDIPLLRDAERLSPQTEAYWALWRESFTAFYEESLVPMLAGGTRVVILRRRLCRSFLDAGAEHAFDLSEAHRRADAALPGHYAWLQRFPGLQFVDADPALVVSSPGAPYGGPWIFHPVEQAFVRIRADLLRIMGEEEATARTVEAEAMAGLLRERDAAAHARDQALVEAARLTDERDQARAEAVRIAGERDEAWTEAARLAEERGQAQAMAATLAGERDAARAATATARAEAEWAAAAHGLALEQIGAQERRLREMKSEAALLHRLLGSRAGTAGWQARLLRWSGLIEIARHAARRRRWGRAEACYRLALRLCPAQPALWLQLGHALKEQGATEAAFGAYRLAERLTPGKGDAARHMAALLERLALIS